MISQNDLTIGDYGFVSMPYNDYVEAFHKWDLIKPYEGLVLDQYDFFEYQIHPEIEQYPRLGMSLDAYRNSKLEELVPYRATAGSLGYDIPSPLEFYLEPGDVLPLALPWQVYLPPSVGFLMYPRSNAKLVLDNTVGIVDPDFFNTGLPVVVKVENNTGKGMIVRKGDRVAQGLFSQFLFFDRVVPQNARIGGCGSTEGVAVAV